MCNVDILSDFYWIQSYEWLQCFDSVDLGITKNKNTTSAISRGYALNETTV